MADAPPTSSAGGTSKETEGPLHVKELGLTQIDGHPEDHPFIADVIFVHGLQGHPQRTWQSQSDADSSTRPRKRLRPLSWKGTDVKALDSPKLFWPADILPQDHKDVRILTFGYDSKVTKGFMGPTSKNGIFQHGNSFLRAVDRARIGCHHRPILFVAHSLGGLVVKQALIEARKQTHEPDLLDIYNSSHAIIFFGTPHRGSDLASWGLMLSTIAEAVQIDTNNAVLRDLDPTSGSSKLEEMRLDFDDILRDSHRSRELRVYSFQEEEGMTSIKCFGGKVVPNESSSLDSRKYGNDTIHANHMNMCRFNAKFDDGYEKFSGILAKYIRQIKTESDESEKARKYDILNRLDFAERRSREHQLQLFDAKAENFSWIWSSSSFMGWLSSETGVFWISGKPGSGKSTMVEHLVTHDRTILELQKHNDLNWTILHFYFDFRGGRGINNSFEGLLRSLLYQLVEAIPQLELNDVDDGKHGRFSHWTERRLRNVLRTGLENAAGGVCIFVDGLDEYEGKVLDLVHFLKSLATSGKTSIKVCVSSRPEPIPSQLLQHLPSLSMSDHNASGILSYCLQTLEILEPEGREDLDISRLSRIIAEQAEGVFLWARFALDEVVQGYFSGEGFGELLVRLKSIPRDLEDVYDRMLSRIEPNAKRECMIMMQLVCFAERSLTWQELLVATEFTMNKDMVISERISDDKDSANASKVYNTYARRLRAKAAGLLELVKVKEDNDESIKLVHRSVSTYLNQKGWQTLGALEGQSSIAAESLYLETCIRYLHCLLRHCKLETNTSLGIWEEWFYGRVFSKGNNLSGIYPFFSYAGDYALEHAKSIERHGASSYILLHDALTEQFVYLLFSTKRQGSGLLPREVAWELWFEGFDAIFVAFFSGLVLYCTNDLATRAPAPEQVFWDRALRFAIIGTYLPARDSTDTVSLALQNVTTVKQVHLEEAWEFDTLKLVLQHDSTKILQLVDGEGRAVTLLWLFTGTRYQERIDMDLYKILNLLIERANERGEDVRQPCGPEGNIVETLMKQPPDWWRKKKLQALRQYYESRSWPFEYDLKEIERW